MNRNFKVKTYDGNQYDVNVNGNDTFDIFVDKVSKMIPESHSDQDNETNKRVFIFIYQGKILNMNNMNEVKDGSLVLCVIKYTPCESKTEIKTEIEKTYNQKQIKAAMVVFLDFIRNNTQLKELYTTNYSQLVQEIIKNQDLDVIIKNILDQTGEIIEAMEKGENIKLHINNNGNGTVEKIDIKHEDEKSISELIDMGFDPTVVVRTYIECNYNKDETLNKLLNL